jgi:hypothetical protein
LTKVERLSGPATRMMVESIDRFRKDALGFHERCVRSALIS